MRASISVRFMPDSRAPLDDLICVDTERHCVQLPLCARRAPSSLDLPSEIHFGDVLVNAKVVRVLNVAACRGSNWFRFVQSLTDSDQSTSNVCSDLLEVGSVFSVEPQAFHLTSSEQVELITTFQPHTQGAQ
jgi:hypothetical protein